MHFVGHREGESTRWKNDKDEKGRQKNQSKNKNKNKNQCELWRLKGYEGYRGRGRDRQRQGWTDRDSYVMWLVDSRSTGDQTGWDDTSAKWHFWRGWRGAATEDQCWGRPHTHTHKKTHIEKLCCVWWTSRLQCLRMSENLMPVASG